MRDALLLAVFVVTVAALYTNPFGARDWQIAAIGGMGAWLVGPLGFRDGVATLADSWNILAFFLGLMLLAAAAESSGLYARAAGLLLGRSPVITVLLLGTAITAILSNDATPLVLTPAIFVAASRRGFAPAPAAYAATFTADGASLLLPVSNPVNLLFYDRLDMTFSRYAVELLPAAAAGILVLGCVVAWRARSSHVASRAAIIGAPAALSTYGRIMVAALPVLAAAYLAAALAGWPLGAITLAAGVLLSLAGLLLGDSSLREIYRRHISPGVFVFVAGLLLLVEVMASAGLLDSIGDALGWLADRPALAAIFGAAAIGVVLSNVLNNWPAALLLSAAIAVTPGQPHELAAGALIGCTIGANFTMVGSLSTVFWMSLGRPRGLAITPGAYAREAAVPTALAVIAACLVAAIAASLP